MSLVARISGWAIAALGVMGAALVSAKNAAAGSGPSSGETGDDGRPILVIGDSYAVGIAAALRQLYPGRSIESRAVGGTASHVMPQAPDAPVYVIVSAGTNDVGVREATDATAQSILRVLGPYGSNVATKGALYYVLPHTKMGGGLGARVAGLLQKLQPVLRENARFKFGAIRPEPAATDRIHFDAAGYQAIARDAMLALATTPRIGTAPAGGSKSGLLPNGALDPAFREKCVGIGERCGIPLAYLLAVMWFETAKTLRSDIRNPLSRFVGLIQFGEQAANMLGTTRDQLAAMSALAQLDYVEAYFRRFGNFSARDPRDAYLAVFAPAGIGKPDAFTLYSAPTKAYEQNKGLDRNKDGTITAGEVRTTIEGSVAQVRAKGWA